MVSFAGAFVMGSEGGDESPPHHVTLSPFALDRTEVTVEAYRKCVASGECTASATSFWDGAEHGGAACNYAEPGREQHPMNCIDWTRAQTYCTAMDKRLPTEAEWEYAARSGGKSALYPWGDAAPDCSRVVMDQGSFGCGTKHTAPVCSRPAGNSAQGLCDMAGNVWEWVFDTYGPYAAGSVVDPKGQQGPQSKVMRGGSWSLADSGYFRAALRRNFPPTMRNSSVGFRCAKSL